MGRLIESTFSTLDGVISNPQEWGTEYWDDQYNDYVAGLVEKADALLLGRKTYEGFAAAWPGRDGRIADRMNALPKHVASRGLSETTWNASVIEGDLTDEVAALKASYDGDILKYGTGEVDHTLLPAGLVDELHLWIIPVVAGTGERVLDGFALTHFTVRERVPLDSGITILVLTAKS